MTNDKDPTSSSSTSSARHSIQELRVADHELHVGTTASAVYTQLSAGAVAFLTDRPVAQARVRRKLRQATTAEEQEKLISAVPTSTQKKESVTAATKANQLVSHEPFSVQYL
jgi:hypothetical protein